MHPYFTGLREKGLSSGKPGIFCRIRFVADCGSDDLNCRISGDQRFLDSDAYARRNSGAVTGLHQSDPAGVCDYSFEQPVYESDSKVISKSLCLALDNIQDPGNLGTIIRLADWFGIEDIFCSTGTVDVFNPKTVQATMGAIARVKVHYCDLPKLISSLKGIPVYGTFLDGNVIYSETLSANGLIVMGNEGNGISREVEALINRRLYIPNYPQERETSESLNVAIATAVVCAEFRRRLR